MTEIPEDTHDHPLAIENQRLKCRIAAMQQMEQDLRRDNRELTEEIVSCRQNFGAEQRALDLHSRERERELERELQRLQQQARQQKEQMRWLERVYGGPIEVSYLRLVCYTTLFR